MNNQCGLDFRETIYYKRYIAQAREQFDEQSFATAFAEGRLMAWRDGIHYTLEETPQTC